ncbi:MAG: hypothetical protein ACK5DD_07775 [Cyclobacteriaceae bacterium]|jgi:hypothetical protein
MKTKILIAGVMIAIASAVTINRAHAQSEPAVKVYATGSDEIKLIFAYNSPGSVDVKFMDGNNVIGRDRINGKTFEGGFTKKYSLLQNKHKNLRLEISSPEVSVTYQLSAGSDGRWKAQLEQSIVNYPLVASR